MHCVHAGISKGKVSLPPHTILSGDYMGKGEISLAEQLPLQREIRGEPFA